MRTLNIQDVQCTPQIQLFYSIFKKKIIATELLVFKIFVDFFFTTKKCFGDVSTSRNIYENS